MKTNKAIYFIAIIILFTSQAICQQHSQSKSKVNISIDWSKQFENTKEEDIGEVFYDDGKYIYSTLYAYKKNSISTLSVGLFDNKMNLTSRKKIKIDEDATAFHGAFFLGGKFVFIYSKLNSKTNTKEFFGQKYTIDLEQDGDKILLWSVIEEHNQDILVIDLSEDLKNIFIGFFPDQMKPKDGMRYGFKVFDNELQTIFEKNEKLDIPSFQVTYKGILLNNNRDIFVFTKVYKKFSLSNEISSGNGKIPGYSYLITKYSKDGRKQNFEIDSKNKFIYNLFTNSEANGDLSLLISYEKSIGDGIEGTSFLKFDASSEKLNIINENIFSKELSERIEDIQKDKPSKKSNAIDNFFVITDLYTVEDGSTYAILEKNYSELPEHISEGMIIQKISADGKTDWCKYIPKYQRGALGKYWLYHFTMYYKNDLFIYYNDNDENDQYDISNSTKPPKVLVNDRDVSFIQIEFDEDGKVLRKAISNGKQMGTSINSSLSKQLSSKRMLIYGLTMNGSAGNRKTKLGAISFE